MFHSRPDKGAEGAEPSQCSRPGQEGLEQNHHNAPGPARRAWSRTHTMLQARPGGPGAEPTQCSRPGPEGFCSMVELSLFNPRDTRGHTARPGSKGEIYIYICNFFYIFKFDNLIKKIYIYIYFGSFIGKIKSHFSMPLGD